jgi:hypothetical protein
MPKKPLPKIFHQDPILILNNATFIKEAFSTTPSILITDPSETASTFSTKEPPISDAASPIYILTELTDLSLEREGNCAAWLTVVGSMLVYYSSFGIINSFGFFQDYYSHELLRNATPSIIAFVGTLQIMLMNVLASVSGALCDEYGVTASLFLDLFAVVIPN